MVRWLGWVDYDVRSYTILQFHDSPSRNRQKVEQAQGKAGGRDRGLGWVDLDFDITLIQLPPQPILPNFQLPKQNKAGFGSN